MIAEQGKEMTIRKNDMVKMRRGEGVEAGGVTMKRGEKSEDEG